MVTKKDFIGKAAPTGYVAGIGRGASGFTTRSDIGPALNITQDPLTIEEVGEEEAGLFSGVGLDADDLEAEQLYAFIDAKMGERRKVRREARKKEEEEEFKKNNPNIQEQFQDLKRNLSIVTMDEWANIPEVTDLRSAAYKKLKKENPRERYTPVPDSVILSSRGTTEYATQLDLHEHSGHSSHLKSGTETSILTDFRQIGDARKGQLSSKLDSLGTQTATTVDASGYITALDSMGSGIKTSTEIHDIIKATTLLQSLVKSNPNNAAGWISLVKVLVESGKLKDAKARIVEGCAACPKADEMWLEAAKLYPDTATSLLEKGLTHCPNSTRLWNALIDSDKTPTVKRKRLQDAIQNIPNSHTLWTKMLQMVDPSDQIPLLHQAIQCLPSCKEFWIQLAFLESHTEARKVLNKARSACPNSYEIWLAAAQLEEMHGNHALVATLLNRAVATLESKGISVSKGIWLEETKKIETLFPVTAAAIRDFVEPKQVKIMDPETEAIQTIRKIVQEAQSGDSTARLFKAREMFAQLRDTFKTVGAWVQSALLEIQYFKDPNTCKSLLEQALTLYPYEPTLYAMLGQLNESRLNDTIQARHTYSLGYKKCRSSALLWILAARLEENAFQSIVKSRAIYENAIKENPKSDVLLLAAALLELRASNPILAKSKFSRSLSTFPTSGLLWSASILLEPRHAQKSKAMQAVKSCPDDSYVFTTVARLFYHERNVDKAREYFEKAIHLNPLIMDTWIYYYACEKALGSNGSAEAVVDRCTATMDASVEQDAVNSASTGYLWSLSPMRILYPDTPVRAILDSFTASLEDPLDIR